MKKKLLAITIAVSVLLCLCACGPKIPTPTETADTFLTALKTQDDETLATVYAASEIDLIDKTAETEDSEEADEDSAMTRISEEELLPKILDFDYELSNEQIDGEKATVDVKVTTYRLGDAFTSFYSEFLSQALMLAFSDASEEEMDSLGATILSGKLADLTEKSYEKTVTLSLSMKDDKWIVDELETGDDVVDALTGGLVTAMKSMEETMSAWDE